MWNFSSFPFRLATAGPSSFAISVPAEMAEVTAFLASPQTSYVNGQIISIDGMSMS